MDKVIENILINKAKTLEKQIYFLKLLNTYNIDYLNSEGEFENKFKVLITKEQDFTIDNYLIDKMAGINSDKILCAINPYENKSLSEVASLLTLKD